MIEKIIERFKENRDNASLKCAAFKRGNTYERADGRRCAFIDAIEIVQEVAKDGGWIPVETELPKEDERVLCYGINAFGSKKYEVSTYSHKLESWMCTMLVDVIAWQRIAPYQKGE